MRYVVHPECPHAHPTDESAGSAMLTVDGNKACRRSPARTCLTTSLLLLCCFLTVKDVDNKQVRTQATSTIYQLGCKRSARQYLLMLSIAPAASSPRIPIPIRYHCVLSTENRRACTEVNTSVAVNPGALTKRRVRGVWWGHALGGVGGERAVIHACGDGCMGGACAQRRTRLLAELARVCLPAGESAFPHARGGRVRG